MATMNVVTASPMLTGTMVMRSARLREMRLRRTDRQK